MPNNKPKNKKLKRLTPEQILEANKRHDAIYGVPTAPSGLYTVQDYKKGHSKGFLK